MGIRQREGEEIMKIMMLGVKGKREYLEIIKNFSWYSYALSPSMFINLSIL